MTASGTPCDWSGTVSRSGHCVAAMRRRRSVSASSGTSTWKGWITVAPAVSVVVDMCGLRRPGTAASLVASCAPRARRSPWVCPWSLPCPSPAGVPADPGRCTRTSASRQPGRDLLEHPAVAVRVAEHGVRLVAATLGVRPGQPDARVLRVEPTGGAVEDLAHRGAPLDVLGARGLDVLRGEQQSLL